MTRIVGIAALLFALGFGADALAYPHFQFTSDTNVCAMCHHAPAGGGMLTGWGREESADTLSRGGDGALLHGALELPAWLDLGGDFRAAALINDTGSADGAELALFPMQADLALRIKAGAAWTATASIGLKGAARQADLRDDSRRREPGAASYLISREHYVMWRPTSTGPYLRAGRFYAPFGLRLHDHTTYVRRYTGFNLLEETYGLSGGWVRDDRELHVTLFASDELRWAARREVGAAALAEWRTDASALGGSARVAVGDADVRATGGAFYKRWTPSAKLLWLAELDATWQRFRDVSGAARWQLAAYAGPVWTPTQGVYAGLAYELFDEDLVVRDVERHGLSSWIAFHPRAHLELMLSGRVQLIGTDDRAAMTLLQLHYYP